MRFAPSCSHRNARGRGVRLNYQKENPRPENRGHTPPRAGRGTLTTDTTTLHSAQHAEAYALTKWGFEVGALNGKAPYTRHGFKDFTTDERTLERWWRKWPTANIGARPPSWAVVLDVDVRSGGLDSWETITGTPNYPTNTIVTITGTGGAHVWYRLPYTAPLNGVAAPGIDVKHHSGYLVMPGSIHPTTGRKYRCARWCVPEKIPELPHLWRKHVYKPPRPARRAMPVNLQAKDIAGLVRFVESLQEGGRNNGLWWAILTALERGHDIAPLVAAGESIGLPATEISAVVRSARARATRRGGEAMEVA
ncbi:bifunctional DNA primase/polymerase [Corynebacterium sp. 366]|uniref:bifunctional DNA primase/polymerase n=1 Tax=Corynebacterium sp. 366 TaxID=2652251 RepID=UPI001CF7115A